MRRGDDDGDTARDVLEHGMHHGLTLRIGQHELLGEVGEDADAVRAGIDHEIDAATLSVEVEIAIGVEDGRRDREDAAIGTLR